MKMDFAKYDEGLITADKEMDDLESWLRRLVLVQKEESYWELTTEWEEAVGIRAQIVKNVLIDAGIMSLGKTVYTNICRLLATVLTLCRIICRFLPTVDLSEIRAFNLKKITYKVFRAIELKCPGYNPKPIKQAFQYCQKVDKRYPMVYSTLELGQDWFPVASSLLQLIDQ